ISYASADIIAEYSLDKASWGLVLGYFGYGYMFGALLGGTLADHFGPKRVWIVAGVAWSIFEMSTAYAGDIGLAVLGGSALAGFAVIRILFGLSEGPAYSLINKTVANWATPRERGFAVSLGLLSTPLGALLTAPVAVALLVLTQDWRIMFFTLGIAGLIALAVFAWVFTDRPEENPRVGPAERALLRESAAARGAVSASEDAGQWWTFFTNRHLVFNAVAYFSFNYVNFMLLTWTPKYLQDQFGFSLSSLWYVGMIPWAGSCITVVLGGRFSDWLLRRTASLRVARSWFAATVLLLTTVCFISIPFASSAVVVIALMSLGNALNSLPNSVYWANVIDTSPPSRTGMFSGITHFIANIASVAAPTVTGYASALYGYSAMFVVTAIITAIGTLAMLLVRPGRHVEVLKEAVA
ncbi:MAG: MFS transporter, partial [Acetobacteraceae bacterium]|nr:MFS transporter [Acetobacteraceae bacterium]